MEKWACFVCTFTILSKPVLGFSNGSFLMSCDSLEPNNGFYVSQKDSIPYNISVSQTSFDPQDEITVTLQATESSGFMGFLLQARDIERNIPVGSFRIIDRNTQGLKCNNVENSSLSQKDSSYKMKIETVWIAPSGTGNVQFIAAVQRFYLFWVGAKSITLQALQKSPEIPFQNQTREDDRAVSNMLVMNSSGCGKSKFCFSNPSGCGPEDPNCLFMSSEALSGNRLKFEMSGLSQGYVSIGFSDDVIMAYDDVYSCVRNGTGQIEVQHAFTTGRTSPTIKPLGQVEMIETSFNNGVIKCSFISGNPISTETRTASNLYYVFLTVGPAQNGIIRKHTTSPLVTSQKVDISKYMVTGGRSSMPTLIKVHGAFMLIAWMTIGSIGMVFASVWKGVLRKPIWGQELWFQAHRFLMLLTVAVTAIAFILPFVQIQGWSGNEPHPIMGCIVMTLALLQPVGAIFRPPPQHKRPLFHSWHLAYLWSSPAQ
ncbi:putative ferric-chelate reductase 1 isoform X2 [Tachyglossus aculeatus]|uniref:putative ferric-chelate reductase 1 isoform X2 n=1 Tax=Tachyglossus aculeatus TaxID=9261 RepID=UPI0018F47448|nr:putative ferric-chelate reductase 1 isoform X2 [Tachyglossus aculeatus]